MQFLFFLNSKNSVNWLKIAGSLKGLRWLRLRMEGASVDPTAPVTHATANETSLREKEII